VTRRELLAGLSGISLASCSRQRAGQERVRLAVAVTPYLGMGGFYLAHEAGYFTQAGLELEIHEVPSSMQAVPLLAGGKLDAAPLGLTSAFINAVAGGAKVRIVAGHAMVSPTCRDRYRVYGSLKAFPRGLHHAGQLKGKRVAIFNRGGFSEFCLDAVLAAAGMSQEEVQGVTLRQPEALAAVASGQIEAMVAFDVDKNLALVFPSIVPGLPLAEVLPDFVLEFIVYGQRLLDGDPLVGVRFLAALLRGDREFVKGKTPRFLEDFARRNSWDIKVTREACRNNLAPEGEIRLESIKRFIEWSSKKGYCQRPVAAEALVDRRFLTAAQELSAQSSQGEAP
jgi:ABC-type nitrate/sulfonate/bicarbonate transport system substrate-binding protein